jgi:outer membrane protein assembly factor BamD (BamD/ComL family)
MRTANNGASWLVLSLVLVGGGCAIPFGKTRDPMGDQSSKSDFFDVEKWPEQFNKTAKALIGKGENPQKARELYATADEQYRQAAASEGDQRQRWFLAAAKGFKDAADRWPDSALEEDALFLSGEAYFFADYYYKANGLYEQLLKKYTNSKHLDVVESRRFSIAQFWLDLNDRDPQSFWAVNFTDRSRPWRDEFGHAVRVYDRIRIDDPTGKLADDATLAAGNAYFTQARYLDADNFYTDLRKTFPSSEHQFTAHLLGLKAKLLSYEGPDYSGDPLDEAEKLVKQIHRQFPREADQEREYLTRAYAEVRYKQAERKWYLARYYDRRSEYGAARFYYTALVRDFSETPFAQRAQERVGEVADRPAVPPQRFAWLVDAFPKEENQKPLMPASDPGRKRR